MSTFPSLELWDKSKKLQEKQVEIWSSPQDDSAYQTLPIESLSQYKKSAQQFTLLGILTPSQFAATYESNLFGSHVRNQGIKHFRVWCSTWKWLRFASTQLILNHQIQHFSGFGRVEVQSASTKCLKDCLHTQVPTEISISPVAWGTNKLTYRTEINIKGSSRDESCKTPSSQF
jgi:hypothetical protein